jgi:hypothetical protein
MKVSFADTDLDTYLACAGLVVQGDRPDRSTGTLHLSQIYRELDDAINPKKEMGERDLRVYRLFGLQFERVMADAYQLRDPERFRASGEVEFEGVVGSPDLLDIATDTVIDFKLKWKSMKRLANLERDFFADVCQNKAYCRMLGEGWRKGLLVMGFVNGDYKESGPRVVEVSMEHTEQELEENWTLIKNHARSRGWL